MDKKIIADALRYRNIRPSYIRCITVEVNGRFKHYEVWCSIKCYRELDLMTPFKKLYDAAGYDDALSFAQTLKEMCDDDTIFKDLTKRECDP